MDIRLTGLPDSTACGSQISADGSVGEPKISFLVVAGMSFTISLQEVVWGLYPLHVTADDVLYAPKITARLLSPPKYRRETESKHVFVRSNNKNQ